MKLLYALLALVCLGSAAALQFTAPAEGASYTSPVLVNYTWDQPATLTIGSAVYATNTTNASVSLTAGTHTAVLTDGNTTVNRTITVTDPVTQTITVTTDKAVYEAGTAARVTVTVSTPGQLTLTTHRNGVLADTYTITVQQQTDFLYTILNTGAYTVTVTGQGASATTSFTAQNSTLGVTITGSATATAGRLASYTAQVNGGTAPYTYSWQFSDNTTSTGQSVEHVFTQNGTYNVTVIVQDAAAKQASAKLAVAVEQEFYRLDVTVMDQLNKLLKDATVSLQGVSGGRTQKTDTFGETRFRNLSAGNYTVNATLNYSGTTYVQTASIPITKNEKVTLVLDIPQPEPEPVPVPVQNSTNTTPQPAAQPVAEPVTEQAAPVEMAAAKVVTPEDLAAQAFEEKRSAKLDELHALQTAMLRSEEKETVLTTLGLIDTYSNAQKAMEQSTTEVDLASSMSSVPKDVVVGAKDTTIMQPTYGDVEDTVDMFLAERGITDSEEQRSYRYNIEETLKVTTVTAKRTVVHVTTYGGKESTYTIYERSVDAPEGTTFIEVIPKRVAADVSEITVDGSHEVLVADPIIRFLQPTYRYYVADETPAGVIVILPVPPVMAEPPSLIGYVAVKLKLNSFDRGGLYLVIIGVCFAAALLGNVYLRRSGGSSAVPAFADLADMTFIEIEKGNYALAAKYLKEVEGIFGTLSAKEKEQTKDILQFFRHAAAVHEFRTSAEHVHNLLALGDTVAVSTAYDRAVHHFEALPEEFKHKEQHTFDEIHKALEQHLVAVEGTH